MSLARELRTWEDVLEVLGRASVCWQGHPLSDRDRATFTEAIVMSALHLTDLSSRHGGIGSKREIVAWAHSCASLDVHALGSFLSDCIQLLRSIAQPCTYSWFKRQLSGTYAFAGVFLAPIRGALSEFLESPNPRGFALCYQFLSFLTHVSLLDLAIDMEPEYVELEARLLSMHYPESLVMEMNSIMCEWLKGFSISEDTFRPRHGKGATAEVSTAAGMLPKYQHLGADQLTKHVFMHFAGVDITTFFPSIPGVGMQRKSVLVIVPKSMKARRTISKEPSSLMYLQQGVRRALYEHVGKCPGLRSHIDFHDQSIGAALAIESSAGQDLATIDLSSASDLVTVELVKAVFRGTPLYPYLVALRSYYVELPSKRVLRMAKFAPMGSALCFPVMTLIFAAAVELAVRRARRTHLGNFPVWRVFGDDIIVGDALYEDVVLVLEALGFILNSSKSYHSPARFRESCGGEGYDGVDVTPMKISRRFQSVRGRWTSSHASSFAGLIDMANTCHIYRFSLLRAWIVRVLLDNPVAPPLFSERGDGALYSPCPDNYRAPRRFNSKYQRMEVQVAVSGVLKPKKQLQDPYAERARLFETLRLSSVRTGDMFLPEHRICVPRGPGRPAIRKVWVDPRLGFRSAP